MADIFISYWTGEEGVANSLEKLLRHALPGTSIFMADSRRIRSGDSWLEIIKRELKEAKVVLSILSDESIKRPWINFEAGAAWIDKVLIPLCFGNLDKGLLPAPYNQLQALQLRDPRDVHRLISDLYHHLQLPNPPNTTFLGFHVIIGDRALNQAELWFNSDIVTYESEH